MATLTLREGQLEKWGLAICGLVGYAMVEARTDLHFWRYPLILGIGAAVVLAATVFPSHVITLTTAGEGVVFTLERSCFGFWKTTECRTLAARAHVILVFETDDDDRVSARFAFADGTSWQAPVELAAKRTQVRMFLAERGVGVSVREESGGRIGL